MGGKGRIGLGLVAVGLLGGLSSVAAAAPWDKLLTIRRIDADPQKTYSVTESNGPWMILACTFSGPKAEEQARDLVLELRKKYKLPAYQYEKTFDFGKEVTGLGVDRYGYPRKMKYVRGKSEVEEVAVLVGDYPAVDDSRAQETLKKLKYYQPDCLKLEAGKETARNLAGFRAAFDATFLAPTSENRKKGPMGHAIVTTNPRLPSDFYAPKGVDEIVLKANDGVEHCLLDCPGKYSVMVAHFTGRSRVIKDHRTMQRELAIFDSTDASESQLVKAAENAHLMAAALRHSGLEAYEFHDHHASIVTIGSFESPGTPGPDGVIELDPRVQRIIEQFKAKRTVTVEKPEGVMVPKKLSDVARSSAGAADLRFDTQPMVVEVPKRPGMSLRRRDTASRN